MKPLPKWVGALALVGTGITTVQQMGAFDLIPAGIRIYVVAICAGILAVTHSLNGTGGK